MYYLKEYSGITEQESVNFYRNDINYSLDENYLYKDLFIRIYSALDIKFSEQHIDFDDPYKVARDLRKNYVKDNYIIISNELGYLTKAFNEFIEDQEKIKYQQQLILSNFANGKTNTIEPVLISHTKQLYDNADSNSLSAKTIRDNMISMFNNLKL